MADKAFKRQKLFGLVLVITIPLICSVIFLLAQKTWFNGISIVCSKWNDELFYYKQVQAMIDHGHPLGYWGYNEGHSLYGNFAAWNPANYILYALIGKIFGWGYYTPIIINLLLWSLTFGLIYIFLKPDIRQWIGIVAVFLALSINIRYIFSCTPESICASFLVIWCLLTIRYNETEKPVYFIVSNLIMTYLAAMRGYYAAFVFITLAILIGKKKWIALAIQTVIALADLFLFLMLCRFFAATYFMDTVHFDNLTNIRSFAGSVRYGMTQTLGFMKEAFKGESMRGVWYIAFLILILCEFVVFIHKKDIVSFSVIISSGGLLIAMWSLYNAQEGARNLMACEAALLLITVYLADNLFLGIAAGLIIGIACWGSHDAFYIKLPVTDNALKNAIENTDLTTVMPLSEDEWDNTVIWPLYTQFNGLYALPSGMGVNCLRDEYVFDNYSTLKSKYIVAEQGSDMDAFLNENKLSKIANVGNLQIYTLR